MAAAKAVALATGADLVGREPPRGSLLGELPRARPPAPPYVTLIVSGGPHDARARAGDVPPRRARPDARRRRRRGLRQGRAAARARVPRWAGARRDGAAGRSARDPVPAGDGGLRRLRLLDERAEDRGAPAREGRAGCRAGPAPARPGGELPGGDRRRAGHEDDRRGDGRACADRAARRRSRGEHPAARASRRGRRARGHRGAVPVDAAVHRQRGDDRVPWEPRDGLAGSARRSTSPPIRN